MTLFISCPDASVQRATAFSTALGWTQDAEMSGADASCFAIAPEQYVMLASRETYAGVGGTDDPPFMYQRQFDDPDGYHWSPFWMKTDTDTDTEAVAAA
ncbi:hypothetical protein DEJ25_09235 [Curtobacterium sp. MCPF17_011]|uniref:VOC family protein n=1 Tax=Curtobacterium sp. MCPF17_011 TaxID=2175652 RepID=UPI000DAAA04B|nr:hypothetical protein [Curtobacterium sp. MCPF17_011]PZF12011.1 hypothetical protein DEJ25_09235 [Curtobacterium sp. MCPF17_011]